MISRSSKHIALAEYTGSFFDVYLVRGERTTDVTEYTANLPAISRELESEVDGYGRAIQSRISITFNNDIWDLLQPLPEDASEIGIVIKHRRFRNSETYKLYYGVAEDLPSAIDSFSNDQLTIQFVSIFSTLGDGDDLVDPDTGEEYRFTHVEDFIGAFDDEFTTNNITQEIPIKVTSDERWWSCLFRPFKKRIIGTETYDNTIKSKSVITDGTYIYYPVNDWIVRFDPSTNTEKIITRIDSGVECLYLEYDLGDIHYVTLEDIGERGYGSFTIATVGETVTPTETFYKYDKGVTIKGKNILRNNHRVSGDTDPDLASWDIQMIGDGNVPPDRNLSTSRPFRGVKDVLQSPGTKGLNSVQIDGTLVDVPDGTDADWNPPVGWWCQIENSATNRGQQLGKCTRITRRAGLYQVYFERPFEQDYTQANSEIFFFPPEIWPSKNLFIPAHIKVAVTYDKDELSDRDMQPVVIEKRLRDELRGSLYYPDKVAELSEGDEILLEPGYYSFTSCDTAEEFVNVATHDEWKADTCAPFEIELDWIDRNGQYLLADNLRVENDMQPNDYQICGPNKVTLSGVQTKWNNGEDVKSYGNIYLYKDDKGDIFIAVNEAREANDGYYTRIRLGMWNSALGRFWNLYKSRAEDSGDNYQVSSPIAVRDNIIYGGAKLYNKNWVKTGIPIAWARPPQGDFKPSDGDGSYTATVLIPGDHTDLFEASGRIRLASTETGETLYKEYFISESQVVTRDLTASDYALEAYKVKGKFTHLILKNIDREFNGNTYQEQVTLELLGQYISVMQGWDIRSVAYKFAEGAFSVIDTATIQYGEAPEGDEDEDGETITVEYDDDWDDCPRVDLSESRVLTGVQVFLKNQEFTVTDYTDELRVTEPPLGEAYVKRNQGSDFQTAFVYLNDVYNNFDIRVEYEYYPDEVEFNSFVVFKDEIYYNETGELNKWRVYNRVSLTATDDFSVGVREDGFYSNLVECDNRLYGFTTPSYTLRQYHTDWSRYIELAETENVRAWDILGRVSSACNNSLYERNGVYYFKRRDNFDSRGELELHGAIHKTIIPPFRTVEIIYRNGKAVVGEGEPKYTRSCDYISDYKHALIVAQEVKDFNSNGIGKYEIEILFRDDIDLLDMFSFNHEGERVSGYTVGLDLNPEPPWISKVTVYETPDVIRS